MRKLFFLFVALLATTCLWAENFEVDGIYYNYLDGNNVEVTYRGNHYDSYNEYAGSVTIPATITYNGTTYSVTSIGYYAFSGCSALTSIVIPNSVTSIGNWAFQYCSSLTSITIPNSVTSIENSAFSHCSKLTSVTIPNSVTSIGYMAFRGCSFTSITIPNSVTSIGDGAFRDCSSLTSITIPNSVTSIGVQAFSGCSSLTSITIPNSVTSIGGSAFYGCSALTSITIPNSVTSIGNTAFFRCSSLTSVTIPNSVTSIGDAAFASCSSLTSVTIPNSVTSIGNSAFSGCSSLTSVTCEATIPPILGTDVFYDTKLSAVYIPDNTLSAYQTAWGNKYAFVNNETTLTLHVAMPGTLEDLIFDAGTRPVLVAKLTLTGTLNDADFTCMRETMTSLVDVDLSGITNTNGVNFNAKSKLVKIIIPTNLTSIENSAFYNCSSLTSITIPESVTSIGGRAFDGCSSLASVTIPNSVTSIGEYAFHECSSLDSITIPNSVTSIGHDAFSWCSSLTSVTIGNSVTSIGEWAFSLCTSLTSITIPNSVTSIGDYAFSSCSSLTSVTIPNSVTSIGDAAFASCSSLTSVTIPNSVTSIESGAFRYCSSLTSITCLGTTPPEADNLGAPTTTCKLIVPHSAYNAYARHTYWGQFLNIVSGDWLVTLFANNNQWGEVTGDGLYTNDTTITITATPYDGYFFLRWSDGNTDNPRTLTVTEDITLTAEFAIEGGCLVTFMDWDGTVLSTVSVAPGEAATAPADPTREGYTFIGWDKDFSAVTDHMTVTAQYQINRYQVRFFDDDNTLLKTDSVEYQSAAVAPANPYHEGYTFTGWDKSFDSITADLDIYAQYEMGENRELTVVYTNSEDNDSEISSHSVVFKIPAAPEIEGFTFLGWQPVATLIKNAITIQAIYEANTPTSAPEVYINPANPAQKLLRNGQVYILKDDKIYTIMGAQIQ